MNDLKKYERDIAKKTHHLLFSSHQKREGVFKNVTLIPQELCDLSIDDIDTGVNFLDFTLDFPNYINAMTGGTPIAKVLNKKLALISRDFKIPVISGSMKMFLNFGDDGSFKSLKNAYKPIVNLSARESVDDLKKCAEYLDTNYASIHLNTGQELANLFGDRDFKGEIKNIKDAVKYFGDNLIVKAVGQGMSRETIEKLVDAGVKNIDISGFGGTNFTQIESNFNGENPDYFPFISTEESLKNLTNFNVYKIASGGIDTPLDMVKAIYCGADITASAHYYLMQTKKRMDKAYSDIRRDRMNFKLIMLSIGIKNTHELKGANND